MRLAAPGYRLRSHYYAYGSNVRNCFRSLHTKDPADTLHPESRASCRQDGVKASRFYCWAGWVARAKFAFRKDSYVSAGCLQGQNLTTEILYVPPLCSVAFFSLPEASHVNSHIADVQHAHP